MPINTSCPVYIINLDCAPDRMTNMHEQLISLNLEYSRIPAVKGADLSEIEINQVYSPALNKKYFRANLSLGEIGCYMSHRNIWRKMVDENIAFAVILEDDMLLTSQFTDIFQHTDIMKQYDLIKLADNRDHQPKHKKQIGDDFELINFTKIPNCTTGYTLSLKGAKKLLIREKLYRPVDIDMQFCHELNLSVFGLRPYPITENKDFTSDIATLNGGFHGHKSTSFIRNIKYRIHLWWHRKNYISGEL
ncbi:MAG: glycosyltransferase family 25 protein [Thalassotalea sp.]|nr:glycosyltransferase family 25 protein [Thalassotalea sp.]